MTGIRSISISRDKEMTLLEISKLLKDSGQTISTAESCTGGMISHLITTVPGSSSYYVGSVVSYFPRVKVKLLKVKQRDIDKYGIVSSRVAEEMSEGVRNLLGTTWSIGITGWADKTGDEFEPAGTAWVSVSGPDGTYSKRLESHLSRKRNIESFANQALDFFASIFAESE